jgi:glycerol-3-phosphate dehydrogenase
VDYSEIDYNRVTAEEVDILLREGEKLAPVMAQTRILRAYAGVRPLVASDNDPADATSAAASCCSITPSATAWKGLSPSPAAS